MLLWISLTYSKQIYVYTIKGKSVKYSAIEDNCTKNFVKKMTAMVRKIHWKLCGNRFVGNIFGNIT